MKAKRIFVAIPLPEKVKDILSSVKPSFQNESIRWVPEQNLHITVHFIGNMEDENIPAIAESIRTSISDFQPFELKFDSLEVIRKRKKPVMIWAIFRQNKMFDELSYRLRKSLQGDDSKEPKPHITLARINVREKSPAINILPLVNGFDIMVDAMELWKSVQVNNRTEYRSLFRFPF